MLKYDKLLRDYITMSFPACEVYQGCMILLKLSKSYKEIMCNLPKIKLIIVHDDKRKVRTNKR